jgi:glycosyltransferase involved in cell wall biosynthesis
VYGELDGRKENGKSLSMLQLQSKASEFRPRQDNSQVFVSFIIPALNEEKHIGACLESIRQLEIPPRVSGLEVIVVDNHSADRTAEISQRLGARLERVPPGNPSRARNVGARAAHGDWLAFVDADCELAPNWLTTCGASLDGEGRAIATAGIMADPDTDSSWVERTWHKITHGGARAEPDSVRWLPTFNLLVARPAFERVGGFDETLPTCEDCDLGYKLAELGPLILDSRTQARHLGASHSLWEFFCREAWRSRGNLRLACRRPYDWSNWLSLLLPPCLVFGFLFSILAVAAAILLHRPVWPWLVIFAIVFSAISVLTIRKSRPKNVSSFVQRILVMATYLTGRTAGLCRSFGRIDH